ncbi:hypothetical protein CK203_026022 [Vitis vinifera]|uniref:Uncharacterized protein n=1 Tax=Vitis vinifera TaxID=29760 RepID=A0A438IJL5_VITVI|nr:hypothetical protein CK203_026022 [Vitis vinifera]
MGGREGAEAEEMERGVILSYPQCSIVILLRPHSYPLTNPNLHLHLSQKPNFSSHLRFSHRRWDSNAETFRTQRSQFNFRDTADDDDDDDESQEMDPGSALLEEVIDSFWIFKALFGLEFGSVFVAFGSRVAMSFGFKSTSNFKMLTE